MTLEDYLKNGNVVFCGYRRNRLPDFIVEKKVGRIKNFTPKNLSEMRDEYADVYLLDHRAVKVLFADFPSSARYVLVRLLPRLSWVVAIPGLIRRLRLGLIKIERVVALQNGDSIERWLVLKHLRVVILHTRLSLSDDIGVQGLLEYLGKESTKYVVLRFYEKLPNLYREGGDLDLLVGDEDELKVKEFLAKNPGKIGVDVWTPSRTSHNNITYYPPPLARTILESAILGPANSRIPAPKEAFLSFAYHTLYHKGLFAGVPTTISGLEANKHPENDYVGELSRLAKNIGLDIDVNMEELDEYLSKEGWRPKLDTLAKIAPRNKWVWKRFFDFERSKENGMGIFILKQKVFDLGIGDAVLKTIEDGGEFRILRIKKFKPEEVRYVAEHLRGGVWNDKSGESAGFLPAMAVAVLDMRLARISKTNLTRVDSGKRIRKLKLLLRSRFDTTGISCIHSTDNTRESEEYIKYCFDKSEIEAINSEIEKALKEIKYSWLSLFFANAEFATRRVSYWFVILKQKFKEQIIEILLH